jgi:hypothetical protein
MEFILTLQSQTTPQKLLARRQKLLALQIGCDCRELLKRGFQILNNFSRDQIGIGEIAAVFDALIPER